MESRLKLAPHRRPSTRQFRLSRRRNLSAKFYGAAQFSPEGIYTDIHGLHWGPTYVCVTGGSLPYQTHRSPLPLRQGPRQTWQVCPQASGIEGEHCRRSHKTAPKMTTQIIMISKQALGGFAKDFKKVFLFVGYNRIFGVIGI